MSTTSENEKPEGGTWRRRDFIYTAALGTSAVFLAPAFGMAENLITDNKSITVQQVIDLILKTIPGAPFKETVDTLKSGEGSQVVTGIVSTMFATVEVIQKAIGLGANFIIAHEPTFYNHADETDWLKNDEVYQFKHELLKKHKIAVWRFHDYWHSHQPDGILKGVLKQVEWEKYYNSENPHLLTIPGMKISDIVSHLRKKLDLPMLKVIGEPSTVCERISLSLGAAGGRSHIQMLMKDKPDLFICGEINEWETSEYIRDAREKGEKRALIILGHAVSEEPGMNYLVEWLQPKLPEMSISHVPSKDPFTWM